MWIMGFGAKSDRVKEATRNCWNAFGWISLHSFNICLPSPRSHYNFSLFISGSLVRDGSIDTRDTFAVDFTRYDMSQDGW